MTMWAVTQTHRFRAAVSLAGMSDMQSEFGQTWVDQWMPIYFGASAYDDPEAYARVSPIRYIRNAATPTLIFAGAGDKECPPAQSLEFWHALKTLGVAAELFIFSAEGHGPRTRGHIMGMINRIEDWFDQRLR
jgi:dipeptidyl aminopeptidase/acylaminoacyl peptidase